MRRHRPAVLLVVAALVLAGCAAGSSSGGATKPLRTVTLVLDWTPNTNHSGIYVAQARGWYRTAGLAVRVIQPGQNGSLQPLAAGRADFAVSVAEEVLPARAQGLPVESIAAILQHNTSSILALRSTSVRRPRDLAGRKYGGFGGQLETALVSSLITCDGGDPKTVRYVQVGDADYRVGLTRHLYDFVWIFDGWEKIELQQIDHLAVSTFPFIDYRRCIPDWYTPLLATNTKLAATHPDVVRAFLAASARGYREAIAHPDEAAADLLKAAPDLNPQLVRLSARFLATRYADRPASWGRQDAAVWNRFAGFLRNAGMIKGRLDVGSAWTNRFLSAGSAG